MEQAYQFLMENVNFKYGDTVVAAISGGPDSMALLHLLSRVKAAFDLTIVCAHVNHNMRQESSEEAIFVEKFCRNNGILFEYMKIEDYGDDNFHNEARTKRYHYFEEIVKKYHSRFLFTAHHGDDLIETILMRIVRGSTLRGYSGFSYLVEMENYTILRPLIGVTKEEILEYDKKNRIPFVKDASNDKDVYTRNRFRKYVVPALKKEDRNVHHKFYKFSRTLLEYNDYIDRQVEKIMPHIYVQNELDIEEFLKLDHVIAMKVIYYILEHVYQEDLMLITDHHAELIFDLITSKRANAYIYLPNHLKATKAYNKLTFVHDEEKSGSYEIELIQYMNLPNGKNIEVVSKTSKDDNFVCRLRADEVSFPLHVRNRMNGDKMHVKGMLGSKKINDIFIDEKIPMNERDMWPIVVDSKGTIVLLPVLKKSKFDKTKDEKYDIILKYY